MLYLEKMLKSMMLRCCSLSFGNAFISPQLAFQSVLADEGCNKPD